MLEKIGVEDIDVKVKASDWEEAIRRSSQYLLDTGKIRDSYVEAMIDAVHRIGPYIVLGNHVALAHARPESGVNELAVHFTTLEPAVEFGSDRFDPIRLVITLAAIDDDSHLELIGELSGILMEAENVDLLADCGSKEEFCALLKRLASQAEQL